ncbi:type II secretion system protein [Burkholderia gladioli]|uniref:type II secretion system protein n=1 Tax=Burkholderia gladioli TaxID=28095 RepID=UPI00163E57DC|nr:type II secretion system protein [Burkholderia gladioli]
MKPGRAGERGIAYLGVLMLVGAIALGAAQAARVWQTLQLREREAQLLFVGDQIRQAIDSYYRSGPGSRYPRSLEMLVEDRRGPRTLRHLRRVYRDPLTGTREWGIVEAPDGGVMGVFSRAAGRPVKRGGFPEAYADFEDKPGYADWRFVHAPAPGETVPPMSGFEPGRTGGEG